MVNLSQWSHHGMVWGYINGNVKRISNMISWPNGNLPAVGIRRNLHVLFDQLRMMNGTGPQIPGLNDVLARIKRIAQRVGENPWFV